MFFIANHLNHFMSALSDRIYWENMYINQEENSLFYCKYIFFLHHKSISLISMSQLKENWKKLNNGNFVSVLVSRSKNYLGGADPHKTQYWIFPSNQKSSHSTVGLYPQGWWSPHWGSRWLTQFVRIFHSPLLIQSHHVHLQRDLK